MPHNLPALPGPPPGSLWSSSAALPRPSRCTGSRSWARLQSRENSIIWAHFWLWKRTTRLFFKKGETVRPTRVSGPDNPGEAGEDARKSTGGVGVPQLGCAKCCTNCFFVSTFITIVTDSRSWPVAIETAAAATVKAVPKLGTIIILLFCRFRRAQKNMPVELDCILPKFRRSFSITMSLLHFVEKSKY